MSQIAITVDTREVDALLLGLSREVRGQVLAAAMQRGGVIVAREAAARAPSLTGRLRESLVSEAAVVESDYVEMHVGPQVGSKVWYGHLVERPTAPHELASRRAIDRRLVDGRPIGFHPGTRGQPFLEPALEENADRVVDEIRSEIRRRVTALRV